MITTAIFLSYDGAMEILGQSQVLAYVKGLARTHRMTLISFEKPLDYNDTARRRRLASDLELQGVTWYPLIYHKVPPVLSTMADLLIASVVSAWIAWRDGVQIFHARSYVPALVGVCLKWVFGVRFIFDMRGFWADERISHGIWPPGSPLHTVAKTCERFFLLNADAVVSLTHSAVKEMRAFPYLKQSPPHFEVIPTSVDLGRFSPRDRLNRSQFSLCYIGSIARYSFDEVLACFKELLLMKPDSRLLIFNRDSPGDIATKVAGSGVPSDRIECRAVEPEDMPAAIADADAGIFFTKADFASKAHQPTRFSEFLACGIPCLTNPGIGDIDTLLREGTPGVLLNGRDQESRRAALRELIAVAANPKTSLACRMTAEERFSLTAAVRSYSELYSRVVRAAPPILPIRTRILNMARCFFKFPPIEASLAAIFRKSAPGNLLMRLAPNHYQYTKGSLRRATVDGLAFDLDISDLMEWQIYFGIWDKSHAAALSMPKNGEVVLDIGANVGYLLLQFGRLVGPSGSATGFEPDPLNFAKCAHNLSLNSPKNVKLYNVGLGARRGTAQMIVDSPANRGGNRISQSPCRDGHPIPIHPLDEFLLTSAIPRADFIKIDVEGFELQVLRGARQTLEKFRPRLFIEVDDTNLQAQGDSAQELICELEGHGYSAFDSVTGQLISHDEDFSGRHFDVICRPR